MQLKLKFFMILALLLTTMTAWAQGIGPLYTLTLDDNYEGGSTRSIPNIGSGNTISLISGWTPTRDGHTFFGWSELSFGTATHAVGSSISITKDLTLYGIWEDTPLYSLKYTITSESQRMAQLTGYLENKPTGALVIPASVTIGGNSYAVTSIGNKAFDDCPGLTSVTFAAGSQLASIGDDAFNHCTNLTSVTLNSNPAIGFDAFPDGATVRLNLTGNEGKTDEYWMTFFNVDYSFQVPDETKIFKAALDGTKLTLTELTTDKIVTKNNPVILKSTSGPISLTLVSSGGSNNFDGNNLSGISRSAGETASDPSKMFVLNKGANGVGFYRLAPGKRLGHGKAFLWYEGALSNFFGMEEETTGLKSIDNGQWIMDNYYDLSGRKVTNPKKGIYIVNGKKVIKR